MTDSYEDIIHLPHHTSSKHPRMSRRDRAAQFAPFAALTGRPSSLEALKNQAAESDSLPPTSSTSDKATSVQ